MEGGWGIPTATGIPQGQDSDSQSVVSSMTWELLEMYILRPGIRHMKAETPRVGLRQLLSPALQVIPVHAEG